MNERLLKKLLEDVKGEKVAVAEALEALKRLPFEELEFATLDTHRSLRKGFPEVIFGEGKSAPQIKAIVASMLKRKENVLATRVDAAKGRALRKAFPKGVYKEVPRTFFVKSRSQIISDDLAALHHELHSLKLGDVGQRVHITSTVP